MPSISRSAPGAATCIRGHGVCRRRLVVASLGWIRSLRLPRERCRGARAHRAVLGTACSQTVSTGMTLHGPARRELLQSATVSQSASRRRLVSASVSQDVHIAHRPSSSPRAPDQIERRDGSRTGHCCSSAVARSASRSRAAAISMTLVRWDGSGSARIGSRCRSADTQDGASLRRGARVALRTTACDRILWRTATSVRREIS